MKAFIYIIAVIVFIFLVLVTGGLALIFAPRLWSETAKGKNEATENILGI